MGFRKELMNLEPHFPPLIPLPHNATFLRTEDIWLWKTLKEKEKLLVTSNSSFSHNVSCPIWYLFSTLNAL